MTDPDRYTRMTCCACPAEWVEDRLEPGPRCPRCRHYEPWPLLENCPRLSAVDGPPFESSASDFSKLLAECGFHSTGRPIGQPGRSYIARWLYNHRDGT